MKRAKVTLRAETTEEFFDRARERARKLDAGELIANEMTISFEDPAELLKVLSSERVRLLHSVKRDTRQVSVLAADLGRDVRAVSRDIALLEKAGLVRTAYRTNPGHGRLRVVESVARSYRLVANL